MDESLIRSGIREVRHGRMSRRAFVRALTAAGLTIPMAGTLLMNAGIA